MPKEDLRRCPKFSLQALQSSPVLVLVCSSCRGPSQTSASSFQLMELSGLCPPLPSYTQATCQAGPGPSPKANPPSTVEITWCFSLLSGVTVLCCLMFGVFQLIPCILPILGGCFSCPILFEAWFWKSDWSYFSSRFKGNLEDPRICSHVTSRDSLYTQISSVRPQKVCHLSAFWIQKWKDAGALFRDKKMRHVSLA